MKEQELQDEVKRLKGIIESAFIEGHNEGQCYEYGADSYDIHDDWELSDVRSQMENKHV